MAYSKETVRSLSNKVISGEQLFFIAFTLSLVASFIVNTTFMIYLRINMVNWVNYFAVALLLIKIYIFDYFKLSEYIAITAILALAFLSWKNTQMGSIMIMFGFICGARGINFEKIVRHYFNVNLTLLLLTAFYSLAGIISNLVFFRGDIYRYSLGIDYSTDLSAYVFYLCLAYCYLNYHKMNWQSWLGLIVIDIVMYLTTNTRVDAFLILLIIPVMLIVSSPVDSKIEKFIASSFWYLNIIFPYVFILLTYYFTFEKSWMVKLNRILSGRLTYGEEGFARYGITLFGRKIIEHGWGGAKGLHMMKDNPFNYFYIDSSFVRLIVINGLIVGIIAFIILILISIRETIRHNYVLPAILFLVVLSSLIDQHLLEITYDPFLLSLLSVVPLKTSGGLNNVKVKQIYGW